MDTSRWTQVENAAIILEGPVGHANAVPIEYLYIEVDQRFYFLELNPRLQEREWRKSLILTF